VSPGSAQIDAALEAAFPLEPRPPDKNIVYDASGEHDECMQVLADYAGRLWTDVPTDILGFNADALHFMTDEAFLYYLPAFIRKYLREREGADLIPQQLISMLTPGEADPARFHFLETRSSNRQKQFIAALLAHVRDEDPFYRPEAEAALSSYWQKALAEANDPP